MTNNYTKIQIDYQLDYFKSKYDLEPKYIYLDQNTFMRFLTDITLLNAIGEKDLTNIENLKYRRCIVKAIQSGTPLSLVTAKEIPTKGIKEIISA